MKLITKLTLGMAILTSTNALPFLIINDIAADVAEITVKTEAGKLVFEGRLTKNDIMSVFLEEPTQSLEVSVKLPNHLLRCQGGCVQHQGIFKASKGVITDEHALLITGANHDSIVIVPSKLLPTPYDAMARVIARAEQPKAAEGQHSAILIEDYVALANEWPWGLDHLTIVNDAMNDTELSSHKSNAQLKQWRHQEALMLFPGAIHDVRKGGGGGNSELPSPSIYNSIALVTGFGNKILVYQCRQNWNGNYLQTCDYRHQIINTRDLFKTDDLDFDVQQYPWMRGGGCTPKETNS